MISRALQVEWRKLRRSPVTLVATLMMAVLVPGLALAMHRVAVSGGRGPLGEKAAGLLMGDGWIGYLGLVDQIAAVAMLLGSGVVAAWVFGREHTDRTFSALFALPVSRAAVAAAKFVLLVAWVGGLAVTVTAAALLMGSTAALGPIGSEVLSGLGRLLLVSSSTSVLALTMGGVASAGRGYLPAIGVLILLVAASQVSVLFGTGGWFPFAIPGLLAVAGADGIPTVTPLQLALIPVTTGTAGWLTVWWWARAQVA